MDVRTFHNVKGGSNLAIYCLLSELEERLKDGPLPPVLFIQIDGGPENANVTMLALCELLIAKGIVREKLSYVDFLSGIHTRTSMRFLL